MALHDRDDRNLHFSGAWSLAEADVEKIRTILLDAIQHSEPILRASTDETAMGIGIDFYRLLT
jgi:hypothetical protein